MKENHSPKPIVIALTLSIFGIVSFYYLHEDTPHSTSKTIIQRTNIKEKSHISIAREVASKTLPKQEEVRINKSPKQLIKSFSTNKVEQKYFANLPDHIQWKVTPISQSQRGKQVKVELEDTKLGRRSSYLALVESRSGRILTTWHRQINH